MTLGNLAPMNIKPGPAATARAHGHPGCGDEEGLPALPIIPNGDLKGAKRFLCAESDVFILTTLKKRYRKVSRSPWERVCYVVSLLVLCDVV